jgi:multidrug efflux pump subunit AcrA (membrane-fusion protein)
MSALAAAIASRAPTLGRGSIRWLNLGLLALAAAAGIISYLVVSSAPASTASSVVQQTGTVKSGVVLSSVSATGSIAASKDLTLNFQSSGTLTHVDVKAGEHVTRGALLGTIDSTAAAASVRQAEAALTSARANLENAVTGETAAQRQQDALSVKQAKAAVTSANAALKNTKIAAASDNASARQALAQAQQQLQTDQGGEAVAVAQQKTDLGTYADLTAAQAAVATVQGAVTDDQTRQHTDQQTQFDLQAQQLQWNQQLAADNAAKNTSAASNDQAALNSLALQLQALGKTIANDAYQLSQDQAALSTAQGTVSAIKADASSVQSYEAKLVADKANVASATTKVASTAAQGTQSIQSATQQVTSAKLQATNAALGVTVKQAPPTASVLAQLQSGIVQAETNLATAEKTLSQTTLRAPVGGTVASVDGIVGQSVSGGGLASATSSATTATTSTGSSAASSSGSGSSSGFVTLIGLSSMQVTAAFAESDVAKLAIGQPATVTISALGSAELAAHIAAIDPIASSSSSVVQYTVTFALDRANKQLKPGMTATVAVTTAEKDNVLQVPSAAVTGSGRNARVTVLKNGVSQTVPVVAGLVGDSSTQIVSGLTAGETYVISTTVARQTGAATGTTTTPATRAGGGLGGFGGGGFGGGGFAGRPGG